MRSVGLAEGVDGLVDGLGGLVDGLGGLVDGVGERVDGLGGLVDGLLEATVVGSVSRLGYVVRRAVEHWEDPPRVDGRVMVVTGASSGVGRAAALELGRLGAEVWALGRDPGRTEAVAGAIRAAGGHAVACVVDVSDPAAVVAFAERLGAAHDRLHGLVHAAGALLRSYSQAADGSETTVATHVLGPFRLTWLLAPLLRRAGGSTIVTVSSGGMYTERLDLSRLEMAPEHYDGVRAYARAKRAQVVLAAEWAQRWSASGVASYAMHPGWVDTPGLASGLPSFTALLRRCSLLRRPEEGADTAVWLAAGGAPGGGSGGVAGGGGGGAPPGGGAPGEPGFWHDRHRRGEHYLPWTRPRAGRDDAGGGGGELWEWCAARTGLGLGLGR